MAARLARAGCRALFQGEESLARGVRVGKHHSGHPGQVARAVEILHDYGIFVHGNFIVGLPGETAATVEQTLTGLMRIPFDSVGGGPFFLTPGSTFARRPESFGITVLDSAWVPRQNLTFGGTQHEYFATETLTQPQMRSLAADFRRRVDDQHLGCWNLSDYALGCWLSVGGTTEALVRLWQRPDDELTPTEQAVLQVLKEKTAFAAPAPASSFVAMTRQLAATAGRTIRGTG